ncbi:MAG TPA: cache domain-containing protein [Usitatibacter sp.]|nr:cache domain-containing protein [Usitatibacter sp.]
MLFALAVLLVGINVLSALWDVRNDRDLVERNALRDFNNLTALLADQTARSVESVDVLLSAAAGDISAAGVGEPSGRALRLKDRISGIPQIRAVLVLDRDGRVIVSTDEGTEIGADFSSRPYFLAQRDGAAGARFVSEPFIGQVTGHWVFAVSKRVIDANGRFIGVLAGIIDIEYFNRLYRSLDIGKMGFVTLLTRGGTVVTRVPPRAELLGKRLAGRGEVLEAIDREGRYAGWTPSTVEGQPWQVLLSAAPALQTPLVVMVGKPEHEVLEPWYSESLRIVVRTLLTSAVMVGLVGLAVGELARRQRADERMQDSRRQAEAEQERLQRRLRQAEKMEAIGRLAGGIAHDFNNNLGGIIGYGEMLLEGTPEGSPEQRYARNLLIAANRARELVDQILTYSRTQKVLRGPVELGRIVRETLEVIRGSLPADIALVPALDEAPLMILGDATQLHQVVMNLCTNATHAMASGGTLSVSLDAVELEREVVFTHDVLAAGPYARLAVADTGEGMDAATLARIFEPFFTTKEIGRGTGLGLSLVYGIVADSGGAIHVTSEAGRGSRFEIHLPRVAGGEGERPVPPPPQRGNGERVLLIDDEKPLLMMTAELLARLGYEPSPFSDPRSALASLEAMPSAYDVVLTDETMPGLTGTELAHAARKARPGLPVVLVSGYTSAPADELAAGAGITEVLRKPVQSRDLAAALARALAGKR